MSVEIRILVPKRIYDLVVRKADEKQISLQELIIIALTKVIEE